MSKLTNILSRIGTLSTSFLVLAIGVAMVLTTPPLATAENPWMNKLIRKSESGSIKTFTFSASAAALTSQPLIFNFTYQELLPDLVSKTFRCAMIEQQGACTQDNRRVFLVVGSGTGVTTESIRMRLVADQVSSNFVPSSFSYTIGCSLPTPDPSAVPTPKPDDAPAPGEGAGDDSGPEAPREESVDPCFEHDDVPVEPDDILQIEPPADPPTEPQDPDLRRSRQFDR